MNTSEQQTRNALRVYTLPTEYYCPTFTASAVVPWWMSELRDGKQPVWPVGWTFTSVDLDRLSNQWDREGKLAPPFMRGARVWSAQPDPFCVSSRSMHR